MKQLKVKLSWLKTVEALNDAECGRLIRGMLQYASSGEAPEFRGNERTIWPGIQEDLDKQRGAFDRQSEVNKRNVTNRIESYRIVSNRNESLKRESTPPTPPGKEAPIPLKKTIPKGIAKERSLSPAVQDVLSKFLDMRKQMRKPMTDYAVELFLNKLEKLAPGDERTQIGIVNRSIENGWLTVYPLDDRKQKRERNTLKNYDEHRVSGTGNLQDIDLDPEEL